MRNIMLPTLGLAALVTFGTQAPLLAQEATQPKLHGYYTTIPWTGGSPTDALVSAAAGSTIPMSNYTITATKDNSTRSGVLAGTSPFASPLSSSTISVVVVPLKITVGTTVFDPTVPNPCDGNATTVSRFNHSPLVASTPWTINGVNVGNTQYINAFRRAEFWNQIGGSSSYQNALTFRTLAKPVSLSPGKYGILYGSGCQSLAIVSNLWLDRVLTGSVIPALVSKGAASPTSLIFFLLQNTVQSTSIIPTVNNCCILGYHSATGSAPQTYGTAEWDTTGLFGAGTNDASISSHELGEWMDDPLGNNPTPAWGNAGQVTGCQGNLEVGDALTGTTMPPVTLNGYTYNMQELVFWSWFFNSFPAPPSLGAGGLYSSNGTFKGSSKVCPPGGTN